MIITFRRVRPECIGRVPQLPQLQVPRCHDPVFSHLKLAWDVLKMKLAKLDLTPFPSVQLPHIMAFLYGAFAGVRSHLSSIGTGARNGELSRRHTISAVVTSGSTPCPPLEPGLRPAGTLRAENSDTDHAGRATVQDSNSNALPTRRNRHKSVTFSSVDVITHLPTNPAVSATSSYTQSSKAREFSVQTRRNSAPAPSSVPPSGLSDPHVTDEHRPPHRPSDKARRRRYTVSGSPSSPRLSCWSPGGSWYDHPTTLQADVTLETAFPLQTPGGKRSSSKPFDILPSIDDGFIHFGSGSDTPPYGVYYNLYQHPPRLSSPQNYERSSIDSAHGYESYQPTQYYIYRVDSPPVVSFPAPFFSGPAGRNSEGPILCNSNGIEYTILPLTSRLSLPHAQHSYSHPECLALLETRTASLVPSHFPPPKCLVEGKGTFVVSHAPNKKGLGMFAQTPLRTGEVILTEVPILIIPSDAPGFLQHSGTLDASTAKVDMYGEMFGLLSDGVRNELIDLAWGGMYSDHKGDVNVYETIMRINPLAVSLPQPSASGCSSIGGSNVTSSIYRGIFMKTSRCNHSCGPNAQWTFDPSSLTLVLTCLRPINTGDEITITYLSPYLPFFHRRADLKNLFGFDCNCDWCFRILSQFQDKVQSRLIEESDSARKFLTTFWDSFPPFEAWSKHTSVYPDNHLISAHKVALEMIEREGLEGLSSVQQSQPDWCTYDPTPPTFPVAVPDRIRHTDRIALCYGVLADMAKFRKWVARALDARLSHPGPGSAGWGAFEDIKWIGRLNGKSLQPNEADSRLGCVQYQTDDICRTLENWIAHPEAFPAWGLRRYSPDGNT